MALFASEIRALQSRGYQVLGKAEQWATTQLGFNPIQAYSMGRQFAGGLSTFLSDPGRGVMSMPVIGEVASVAQSLFGGGRDFPYLVQEAKKIKPGWSEEKILGMLRYYAWKKDPALHKLIQKAPFIMGPSIGLDEQATRGFLEYIASIGKGPKAQTFWAQLVAAARYKKQGYQTPQPFIASPYRATSGFGYFPKISRNYYRGNLR